MMKAKVLMLTKLYDIEENEAATLIESNESEPNTTEANESNEGTDTGAEEDNTEEQTQSNNN